MNDPFFQLSIILVSGLFASWIAGLLKIPNILLMLMTGFVIGPISGLVNPNVLFGDLLLPIVSLSVAIILFEGGLSLDLRKVKRVGLPVVLLMFFGILLGIGLGGLFLEKFLGFSPSMAVLVSSILVITGPTVIIPLLQQLHIKEPARSILRWEGILIDPIGAIGSVLIFEALFTAQHSFTETLVVGLLISLSVGIVIGLVAAFIFLYALKKFLIPNILINPVVLSLILFAYAVSNSIQADSGLVTATVMGLFLANQKQSSVKHVIEFKESLRVILIAFLFVTLSASINLEQSLKHWDAALYISLFLLLILRPLTVLLSTNGSSLNWREKILIASIAPRGIVSAAVASLFALSLVNMGFQEGEWLASLVFSVIAVTVCVSSIAAFILTPYLGLSSTFEPGVLIIGANSFARAIGKSLSENGFIPYYIDTNFWKAAEAKQLVGNVFYGNFIRFEEENQEALSEIGTVLALTENDGINSLALNHFSRFFNREQLYQFHPEKEEIPKHLKGRCLFSGEIKHSKLREMVEAGALVRSTLLTPQFSYKSWESQNPNAFPLFLLPPKAPLESIYDSETMPDYQRGKVMFLDLSSFASGSDS